MTQAIVHAPRLMHRITVKVTGLREMSMRIWLAGQLFRLGAWVSGCSIEIATKGDE